jgi:hypothetical protein
VFAVALLFYFATAGGSMGTKDAVGMYQITVRMLRDHAVSQPQGWQGMETARDDQGRYYAPFGIGQSLYNIPFYLTARVAESLTGIRFGRGDTLPKAAVVLGSAVAAAATVSVAFLFAIRLTGDSLAACAAAFSLGFATLLWPYARFGFNAALAALCLVSGVYLVWVGVRFGRPRALVGGGLSLGAAMLTRHELALVVAPVAVWIWWESDRRIARAWRVARGAAAGFGFCAVIWLAYNAVRFGNPFYTGYRPTFGIGGWYGLIASPQASLLLYSPIVALAPFALTRMWKHDGATAALFAGVCSVLFAFYASLADWQGVRSYGPRYLVPALSLLSIPLAYLFRDLRGKTLGGLLVAAAVSSAVVQLPAVAIDPSRIRLQAGSADEDQGGATLAAAAPAAWRAVRLNAAIVAGHAERPTIERAAPDRSLSDRMAFSLDFWWMYLFHLGLLSATAALGSAAACLLAGSALLVALIRPSSATARG